MTQWDSNLRWLVDLETATAAEPSLKLENRQHHNFSFEYRTFEEQKVFQPQQIVFIFENDLNNSNS